MKKVKEPDIEGVWQCPRCHKDYCNCVIRCKVNFDISDGPRNIQWKNLLVCPKCHNQLVDLKECAS